jgi:hypothetical protein
MEASPPWFVVAAQEAKKKPVATKSSNFLNIIISA